MIIKVGSSGTAVSKIQYKLGEKPDGIFGKGTEEKVKAWQESKGLDADGIIGEGSWTRMFGCGMDHFTPVGIIVHSMTELIDWEGETITAEKLLQNLGLSVHALIHPDGKIEEIIPPHQKAAHAGKSVHNGLSGLNSFFLGYELLVEGKNDFGSFSKKIQEPGCYTDAQFDAAVKLTSSWMNQFHISKEDVVRHSDVSGDHVRGAGKGKTDPGNGFDWDAFLSRL